MVPANDLTRHGIARRGRRDRPRHLPRLALTVLGYSVLVALTLEATARVDDYLTDGASPWRPYTINTVFQATEFGRGGKPGAHFGKWSINSQGFRGPEPAPGRQNVLTYGASETFGLYESPGAEYPRQLEARLNQGRAADSDGYNVINLGLPGLRIGRTAYLADAIRRFDARYVVVYPSPANYIGTTEPFCGQASQPAPVTFGALDHLRIAGKIDRLAKKHLPPWLMSQVRQWSTRWAERHLQVQPRVPQASLDAFQADLSCVVQTVRDAGATPVLVTHATWFGGPAQQASATGESARMLSFWRSFYPELAEDGFLDLERRANTTIGAVAVATGSPLVDAAVAIPGGADYFADFVHFTDKGAAAMADLLVAPITQRR